MDEDATNADENYLKLFKNYSDDVIDHLNGADVEQGSLHPSYFSPCSYWTSEDKDLFFHALAVHSRLRPDLIAAEIPRKTLVDVCVYLSILSEASVMEKSLKLARAEFEPAVEMSNAWLKFEEERAASLITNEAIWANEHREEAREKVIRDLRKELERQQGEKMAKNDRAVVQQLNMLFKAKATEKEARWRRDDYMRDLCGVHLRVIDGILRDAEEPPAPSKVVPQEEGPMVPPSMTSPSNAVPDAVIDPVLLSISNPDSAQHSESRNRIEVQLSEVPPSSSPSLPPPESPPPPNQKLLRAISEAPSEHSDADQLANLSPRSRRRHTKRLYMRRKRAARSGGTIDEAIARLRPGRKTNKVLERTLSKSEREASHTMQETNVDEANLNEARFSIPSEEQKEDYMDVHAGKGEFEVSLHDLPPPPDAGAHVRDPFEEERDSEDETKPVTHISGQTLPYRVKEDLLELGYDAATLEKEGLGLFHLTNLAKLMTLHAELCSVPNDVGSCISASTIQLLHAHVVNFLTELMHRTLALREHERTLKAHTKVWKLREHTIQAATVHQAVGLMGSPINRKRHFSTLVDRASALKEPFAQAHKQRKTEIETLRINLEESDGENEDAGDDDDDDSAAVQQSDGFISTPTTMAHQELNAPFIWHACLFVPNPSSLVTKPSSRRDKRVELSETLMADDTDEDALQEELLEEQGLDALDIAAAKQAQAALFAKMKSAKKLDSRPTAATLAPASAPAAAVAAEQFAYHRAKGRRNGGKSASLRFAEPNSTGGIKSNVYIEDSD